MRRKANGRIRYLQANNVAYGFDGRDGLNEHYGLDVL